MLKQLRIINIILIESSEIDFMFGLNALTGETGAGKSAIMDALSLVLGERTDTSMIRNGCEKGSVEAVFDISYLPGLQALLDESGINHDLSEELIIRREISITGKSRAFVNHQTTQLALLKNIGNLLIEIIGQHSNQRLRQIDSHRGMVDNFGGLHKMVSDFKKEWQSENRLREQLNSLVTGEAQRLREIEVCKIELEELTEGNLKEGEEEELFAEYSLLSNVEERTHLIDGIVQTLSGEKQSVIAFLGRQKAAFDQLSRLDPSLADSAQAYQNAIIELQEISYTLKGYQSSIEHDPEHVTKVNERLGLINKLKRKYGNSISEIEKYRNEAQEKLLSLENTDIRIEDLKSQLKNTEEQCHMLASEVTRLRQQAAKKFEKDVTQHLRSLNMPKVEFQVHVTNQKRSVNGDDCIEFFLAPNIGESLVSIRECASGGELSRLLLALQTVLAGKENTPTLVFDEIDSNIGGQTAVVVGNKLAEIGKVHQVLCITHFSQVASQANHHIQISKHERQGRTITSVLPLNEEEKQLELVRMQGGALSQV